MASSNEDFTPERVNKRETPVSSSSDLVAHPRRSTRLPRILSGLAAVILAATLVEGCAAVTRLAGKSPTVSSTRPSGLYVVQNGVVYRLAASSGQVLWQDRLVPSRQSGSASLQVANGEVYVLLDFDLYALAASTGEPIWHVTNPTPNPYFWFEVDTGRIYLYSLDNTFSALSAADGSLLWHTTTFTTEDGYGSSVLGGNLYTVNSDATQLYTLDGATGQVRWHAYLAPVSFLGTPLVADGVVYTAAGNLLYALNEQTGAAIWKQPVPVQGSFAAALLARGVLYVTNVSDVLQAASSTVDTGNFFAYDAHTGRLLWAAEPGYATLFDLPITSGLLFASREYNGAYSIAGLDPQTGRVAWQAPFPCGVSRFDQQVTPSCGADWTAIINGKLYVLESAGQPAEKTVDTLKSFNPGTGQLLSASPLTPGQAVGVSNGFLYVRIAVPKTANDLPYADFIFAAYRLSDGSLAWSHVMPLFPPPNGTSANTEPNTSQPVLVP